MNKILIAIIIYNPSPEIVDRITLNLLPYNYVIVDNSDKSMNNLVELINKLSNIHYIKNNTNLGIAAALNIAATYAKDKAYQWLLTMDQDSVITKDIIDKMLFFADKFEELDKLAIISPRHIMQYGVTIKLDSESTNYSETINTMTSGNLLNLTIWDKLGGFDESLFIDMVDMDYYCKAMEKGYKVITLNNVYMQHELGDIIVKKILGKKLIIYNHNYIRKYYQVRNGLIVYNRYRQSVPQVKIVLIFVMMLFITLVYERKKLLKLKLMLKGVKDFLFNNMAQLNVR